MNTDRGMDIITVRETYRLKYGERDKKTWTQVKKDMDTDRSKDIVRKIDRR